MAIGVIVELFKAVVGPFKAGEILQQAGVLIGHEQAHCVFGLDLRVCGLGFESGGGVAWGLNERKYQGVGTVLAVCKALPQRFNLGKVIVVDWSSPEQIAPGFNGAALKAGIFSNVLAQLV